MKSTLFKTVEVLSIGKENDTYKKYMAPEIKDQIPSSIVLLGSTYRHEQSRPGVVYLSLS